MTVLRSRTALDETLEQAFRVAPGADLDERDRALTRAIAVAAMRRLGTLRAAIHQRLARGLPRRAEPLESILIVGAAQVLLLDVPDHAAVDAAVEIAKAEPRTATFAPLVNAVLRRIAAERDAILRDADPLDVDTPPWLAERWTKTYGEAAARLIAAVHRQEPALDITTKGDAAAWAARLGGVVLPTGSVRLRGRAAVASLPGYGEGAWWVQDAAAALPARLLMPQPGERIADLCAAPGGKTAQLAAAGADVTAVDRSARRLERLLANMARLDLEVTVLVQDALTLDEPPFDAILVDAPCSATGTIRRHPDVAWTKREDDVVKLAALQQRLLDKAAALLKPGGRLVFSTCSLEPEEGEVQVEALLARSPGLRRMPISGREVGELDEAVTAAGDMRLLPFHLGGGHLGEPSSPEPLGAETSGSKPLGPEPSGREEARRFGSDGFFVSRLVRDP